MLTKEVEEVIVREIAKRKLAFEQEGKERERRELRSMIDELRKRYHRAKTIWYTFSFLFFHLSVLFVVAAGLVHRLDMFRDKTYKTDLSGGLSLIAVLVILPAAVIYYRKWRINEDSLNSIEQVRADFTNPTADLSQIRTKVNGVIKKHGEEII